MTKAVGTVSNCKPFLSQTNVNAPAIICVSCIQVVEKDLGKEARQQAEKIDFLTFKASTSIDFTSNLLWMHSCQVQCRVYMLWLSMAACPLYAADMVRHHSEECRPHATTSRARNLECKCMGSQDCLAQGLEDSVRTDVEIVKESPLLQDVPVHGFIYDVTSGALQPVSA